MTVKARLLTGSIIVGSIVLAVGGCTPNVEDQSTDSDSAQATETQEPIEVDWEQGWESALQRAAVEDKRVLVDFSADWCVWCRRLESTTLRDPKVGRFLQEHVIPIKLDVDGTGRAMAKEQEVVDLPTVAIFDASGRELGRITGYMSPATFLARLEEIVLS
ncbi:MAG: DUF255 domain-containing protein [bacterium]|nr:DUF255 domain-containing protein [bacterium]